MNHRHFLKCILHFILTLLTVPLKRTPLFRRFSTFVRSLSPKRNFKQFINICYSKLFICFNLLPSPFLFPISLHHFYVDLCDFKCVNLILKKTLWKTNTQLIKWVLERVWCKVSGWSYSAWIRFAANSIFHPAGWNTVCDTYKKTLRLVFFLPF